MGVRSVRRLAPPAVRHAALCLALLFLAGCGASAPVRDVGEPPSASLADRLAARYVEANGAVASYLAACRSGGCAVPVGAGVEVDTLVAVGEAVEVRVSRDLGDVPFRPATAAALTAEVGRALAGVLPGAAVRVVTRGSTVEDLVPNRARAPGARDVGRLFPTASGPPLVRPVSPPHRPTAGVQGRHVALWPSHGWLYNAGNGSWGWQRARLFTTIEDLMTVDLVTTHLTPMLERAGAVVLLPRERDPQRAEVIVDDADPGYAEAGAWRPGPTGFARRPSYGDGVNPFALGASRVVTETRSPRSATWTPDLPRAGAYAVHVSYAPGPGRDADARYTVRHAGGETTVSVNQTMGAGTWVYVGTFEFEAGRAGAVTLAPSPGGGATVSADAVRFGGGEGIVAREGETSGRPRWVEAARYYEQFAGAPPFVYNTTGEPDNDYVDDYRSRGEWVNWLRGAPFGPTGHGGHPGLGIPVDLSLAWHTDAGIDRDGTIGTLVIYNVPGMDSTRTFPNGVSRLANRDLADLLQAELVGDLRQRWRPDWRQRSLWDRPYSEATRPNVPSVLLELLSHQNFLDVRYGLDPRFRFDAARAAYKAIGRFLADQEGAAFVPQPLRPTHLVAVAEPGGVRVSWRPQPDPLEPDADATGYVLYTRDGVRGWDGGVYVAETEALVPWPPPGVVRSWRVAAVNAGGASRPSAALAVGSAAGGGEPVLVVDGFDRVAPPPAVVAPGRVGFTAPVGVPEGVDVMTVGRQLELDPDAEYENDAEPGWGKSAGDLETTVIAGNDRDHAARHGRMLLAAGRSFVSASAGAVEAGLVDLGAYPAVDLVLGLERRTPWPDADRPPAFEALPAALRQRLGAYLDGGGALVVSGAHWAGDAAQDPASAAWARRYLGVEAAGTAPDARAVAIEGTLAPFVSEYNRDRYAVRDPDVLAPVGDATAIRYYPDYERPVAVLHGRAASFAVPLEAIEDDRLGGALLFDALTRVLR